MKVLQTVQTKVLRWINIGSERRTDHTNFNLLPISLFLQLQILLFVSKALKGYYRCETNDFVYLRETSGDLRATGGTEFENEDKKG